MQKKDKKRNFFISQIIYSKTLIIFLLIFLVFVFPFDKKFATAQIGSIFPSGKGNNPISELFTGSYLKVGSNAGIEGSLNVKNSITAPVFNIISQRFRGRIYTAGLTEERRYVFPNLSGEICLSTGNCTFADDGTPGIIARFTERGLGDSLIVEREGNIGIAIDNPLHRLHVSGKIQASEDICTDIGEGFCLSSIGESFEKQKTFSDSIVDGEGSSFYIPLWKSNRNLGDSIIYQSEKNIGIGVVPTTKLDVAGTVRMLGFRLPVNPEKGYGLMSDENGFGTWRPVLTPEGTAADIAERFSINPDCKNISNCPEPGDIVSINKNGFIQKSFTVYDSNLIGIVSTEPELTLNSNLSSSLSRPIALIGRVPTKVSLENGEINPGDFLTSSSLPGVAMKATNSGRVVGMSLESFSSSENKKLKIKKIDVLINPHYYKNNNVTEKNNLSLIDKKTGKKYCLEIINGELKHSLCE